jgi:hypothetical protein
LLSWGREEKTIVGLKQEKKKERRKKNRMTNPRSTTEGEEEATARSSGMRWEIKCIELMVKNQK